MTAARTAGAAAPVLALVLAGLTTGGCIDALDPDVGPPLRAACQDVDSDPATAVSYQRDVADGIFHRDGRLCVHCHTAAGDTPLGFLVGGLDLGSYDGLRHGGAQAGADAVIPGRPCASALYRKVVDGHRSAGGCRSTDRRT